MQGFLPLIRSEQSLIELPASSQGNFIVISADFSNIIKEDKLRYVPEMCLNAFEERIFLGLNSVGVGGIQS